MCRAARQRHRQVLGPGFERPPRAGRHQRPGRQRRHDGRQPPRDQPRYRPHRHRDRRGRRVLVRGARQRLHEVLGPERARPARSRRHQQSGPEPRRDGRQPPRYRPWHRTHCNHDDRRRIPPSAPCSTTPRPSAGATTLRGNSAREPPAQSATARARWATTCIRSACSRPAGAPRSPRSCGSPGAATSSGSSR